MKKNVAGMVSLYKIARAFNVSTDTVRKWADPSFLETPLVFEEFTYTRSDNKVYTVRHIEPASFWAWVGNHLDVVKVKRYVPSSLPMEPKELKSWIKKLPTQCANRDLAWTDEEDEFLLIHYFKRGKTSQEVAKKLERPLYGVRRRITFLRTSTDEKIKKYTALRTNEPFVKNISDRQLEYLKENYGRLSNEVLAKKLKVTVILIEKTALYYGFGNAKINQGLVSLHMVANAFGVGDKTVVKWCDPEKFETPLVFETLPPARRSKGKRVHRGIAPEKLWAWVKTHLDVVDLRKYTPYSIPPEPKWFFEALKQQRKELSSIKQKTYWTESEDERLLFLYYNCAKTQKEIAKEMNRTELSVQKRLKRLREKRVKGLKKAN